MSSEGNMQKAIEAKKRLLDLNVDFTSISNIVSLDIPEIKEQDENIISQIQRFTEYKLKINKEIVSNIALDIIQKGGEDTNSDCLKFINESLYYFIEVQNTLPYVKKDFARMKTLIEDIISNKVLIIQGNNGIKEFMETYRIVFNPSEGSELKKFYDLFFKEDYITLNSREISTPKTRLEDPLYDTNNLSFTNENNLEYKRQYLIEFLSYIYIKKKREIDEYFYYIHKLYELSKYRDESVNELSSVKTGDSSEFESVRP